MNYKNPKRSSLEYKFRCSLKKLISNYNNSIATNNFDSKQIFEDSKVFFNSPSLPKDLKEEIESGMHTDTTITVINYLLRARNKTKGCKFSVPQMMKELNLSRTAVQSQLRYLKHRGLFRRVQWRGIRDVFTYYINPAFRTFREAAFTLVLLTMSFAQGETWLNTGKYSDFKGNPFKRGSTIYSSREPSNSSLIYIKPTQLYKDVIYSKENLRSYTTNKQQLVNFEGNLRRLTGYIYKNGEKPYKLPLQKRDGMEKKSSNMSFTSEAWNLLNSELVPLIIQGNSTSVVRWFEDPNKQRLLFRPLVLRLFNKYKLHPVDALKLSAYPDASIERFISTFSFIPSHITNKAAWISALLKKDCNNFNIPPNWALFSNLPAVIKEYRPGAAKMAPTPEIRSYDNNDFVPRDYTKMSGSSASTNEDKIREWLEEKEKCLKLISTSEEGATGFKLDLVKMMNKALYVRVEEIDGIIEKLKD